LKAFKLFAIIALIVNFASAQKTLQVFLERPKGFKKFEFYCADKLSVKLKHQKVYHEHSILNMNDSLLLLDNDSVIKLSNIKAIKFKRGNNTMGRLGGLFAKGAIGIILVNLTSNMLVAHVAKVDPRAMYICGSFLAGYMIFQIWNTKHIHINKRVTIKVLDPVYNKLKL
jgi:hypothetical protein